jgi:hypothetical protein
MLMIGNIKVCQHMLIHLSLKSWTNPFRIGLILSQTNDSIREGKKRSKEEDKNESQYNKINTATWFLFQTEI